MKEEKKKNIKRANNVKVWALLEQKRKKEAKKKQDSKLKISDIKHGEGAQVNHLLNRLKAKEKQWTFLCVFAILFVILVSLYFVFSSVQNPVRYQVLKVGNFEVTFLDRGNSFGNIVNFTSLQPMSIEEGEKMQSYKVKIVNTSPKKRKFQVKLQQDKAMIEEDGCSNQQVPGEYLVYQIDAYSPQLLDASKYSPILYSDTLDGGDVRFLEIRLWVSDSLPEEYLTYHYHGKFSVKEVKTTVYS